MIKPHRLWTDADDKLLRKMVAERKTVAAIAMAFDRSELSVAIRGERLGLKLNRHEPG